MFTFPSEPPWLAESTILVTRAGSHAYGTSTPTSDEDYRGIAIPPLSYWIGYGLHRFDQCVRTEPVDLTIFGLAKYLALAADANPNILEQLFCADEDVVHWTWYGEELRKNRNMFLSKRCLYTYSGYAMAQLKRIKGHREFLLHPKEEKPTRAQFGLPDHQSAIPADQLKAAQASINKQIAKWVSPAYLELVDEGLRIELEHLIHDHLEELGMALDESLWPAAARTLGFDTNFMELLERERGYHGAMKQWEQYQTWKKERNEARAALEAKWGYDTKHGMHLVRLMRTCREILTEGTIHVRRPDAEELLAIRNGLWTYEEIVSWAKKQDEELREVVLTSTLPKEPNRNNIQMLCMSLVRDRLDI